tara:strand:+ start:4304 stop:4603 length:300 start_codon:yes stop_codon:yes gene_type:complete
MAKNNNEITGKDFNNVGNSGGRDSSDTSMEAIINTPRDRSTTSISYNVDKVEFNDVFPLLIDLSVDSNIVTIDAKSIVYKTIPFNEVINTKFKTYISKG